MFALTKFSALARAEIIASVLLKKFGIESSFFTRLRANVPKDTPCHLTFDWSAKLAVKELVPPDSNCFTTISL